MTAAFLTGVSAIAHRYDGFILDVWGVLHDGTKLYPGVKDCLERLRDGGKTVVLLSNAPMRTTGVRSRLAGFGILPALYHDIMTSGEEVWQNLRDRTDPFYAALGDRCLWLGPDRHGSMVRDLKLTMVKTPESADFILNTGPDDLDEQATLYQPILDAAAGLKLPMVCANADLHVMQGDEIIQCAGILAKRYEERGGFVRWHGKPFPSVYHGCFKLLGEIRPTRILAVGDNMGTDIAGACGVGLDCALVAGGIHADDLGVNAAGIPDPNRLAALISGRQPPTWVLPQFRW